MTNKSASKIQVADLETLLKPTDIATEQITDVQVIDIPIEQLVTFKDHPFKVLDDASMIELVSSILKNGILSPVIVRKKEKDLYEIISGHRRTHAAEIIGLGTVPAIVKNISDEEAILEMVNANIQRTNLLPSEKARAYKMEQDALEKAPQKIKGRKLASLYERTGDSHMTISRYIHLNELSKELMELLDKGKIPVMAGVNLSYLPQQEQAWVYTALQSNNYKISKAQSEKMKKQSAEKQLTEFGIALILSNETKRLEKPLTIDRKKLLPYFDEGTDDNEIISTILTLLTQWSNDEVSR